MSALDAPPPASAIIRGGDFLYLRSWPYRPPPCTALGLVVEYRRRREVNGMSFPSFEDFLNTLSPEVVKEIMDSAQEAHDEAQKIGPGGEVPVVSWTIATELLARYHIWLQQSLSKRE